MCLKDKIVLEYALNSEQCANKRCGHVNYFRELAEMASEQDFVRDFVM